MSLKEARERVRGGERPDHVFICGSLGVERFHDRNLNSWIASLDRQKIGIGALDTGAWVLADAGMLDGRRCAIHWESLPAFSERFPEAQVYADLFEVDGNCYTCAGGTASLDMMLHLIGEHLDEQIVTKVCEQALTDRMRSPTDRQRLPLRARLGLQNTKLLFIIELMEANISEPLSLVEIAKYAGLSRRQIERLFRRNLGRSPARYYLEIRLDRARHLLIQSDARDRRGGGRLRLRLRLAFLEMLPRALRPLAAAGAAGTREAAGVGADCEAAESDLFHAPYGCPLRTIKEPKPRVSPHTGLSARTSQGIAMAEPRITTLLDKGSRDTVFHEADPKIGDFAFTAKVANVFDDMVSRSVPYYEELQRMACELARDFARPNTRLYDVGCSTATTLLALDEVVDPSVAFVGIDNSESMLAKARQKVDATGTGRHIDLVTADVHEGFVIENASVVTDDPDAAVRPPALPRAGDAAHLQRPERAGLPDPDRKADQPGYALQSPVHRLLLRLQAPQRLFRDRDHPEARGARERAHSLSA